MKQNIPPLTTKKFSAAAGLALLCVVATMMVLNPSVEREGACHFPPLGNVSGSN